MIVIVSNRSVSATDPLVFSEAMNAAGPNELRLAVVRKPPDQWQDQWHVNLLPETDNRQDVAQDPPSRQLFDSVIQGMVDGRIGSKWVFYIHGFDQSFVETLQTCHGLQERYGVNVIGFSWSTNPGGCVIDEYQQARQAARISSGALDRCLDVLSRYLVSVRQDPKFRELNISLNGLMHGLGTAIWDES